MKRKTALLIALATLSTGVAAETGCVGDQVLQTIALAFRIAGVWVS